jgi:fatty-acyl-CoA synthase
MGPAAWTLRDLVASSLADNARRLALVCDDERLTYEELDRASLQAALDLRDAGVEPGDRVALLVANGLEYPVYDLAVLRAGAVKIPLNDMLAPADAAFPLEHSGARVLVVSPGLAALGDAARETLSRPPPMLTVKPVAQLLAEAGEGDLDVAIGPDDFAAIYYTGGTTGKPKAIVHSQRNLAVNMLSTVVEAEIGRDERLLLATPLPHAAGVFTLAGLVRGATVVIERRFDVDRVLAAIAAHGITWTFMVPTMIYRVLDAPALARTDHGSLRTVLYGAAPIRPDRLAQAVDVFGPAFIQLYGQTECPNFATTLSKRDHVSTDAKPEILTSCGRPCLMAQVTIRDEEGRALPAGEVGEVCVRAPYTMTGYLDDPDATATRFFGDWLRTGDLGELDADGYLYLKDRRNDMVISGGMNVYSSMVERVVGECPGVAQAAVIGIPDPDWGEAVHAVVTVRSPDLAEEDVIAYCRDKLAGYMRPKSVEIVDEMPLTPYGKMDKKRLRARHWEGASRQIG